MNQFKRFIQYYSIKSAKKWSQIGLVANNRFFINKICKKIIELFLYLKKSDNQIIFLSFYILSHIVLEPISLELSII